MRFQTIHHCSVDVAHGLALLEVQAWWRIFFSSSFFADLKVRFFFPSRLRSRDARRFGASLPMRMTASWFGSSDLPDTRLWRDCNV